ncbi:MAG: hypothetical protein ACLGIT_09570 [Gammaproteobacteria bacterium]
MHTAVAACPTSAWRCHALALAASARRWWGVNAPARADAESFLALDDHLLRDIGVPPEWRHEARALHEAALRRWSDLGRS